MLEFGPKARPLRQMLQSALSLEYAAKALALVALYYVSARLGQYLAFGTEAAVSPVWPPAGVALAGMLVLGPRRYWPVLVLADLLATFAMADAAPQLPVAIFSAVVKAGIYAGGAYLLQRYCHFDSALERQVDVLTLVVLAAPITSALAATFGLGVLWLGGSLGEVTAPTFAWLWWVWWIGDVVGVVVVAPAMLTWSARPGVRWSPRRIAEGIILAAALGGVGYLCFGTGQLAAYAIFPPLIWAALRFGPRGAGLAVLVVSGISILYTTRGMGPFAYGSVVDSLAALETFTSLAAVTVLILAAVIGERQQAARAMRFQARLLDVVNQAVIATTVDGRVTYLNDYARALYGWPEDEALDKPLTEFARPEGFEHLASEVTSRLQRATSWTGELTVHRRDGTAFPSLFSFSPVLDVEGRLSGVVTVSIDLTSQKQAAEELHDSQEQLRQAQKMEAIGLLAGGVAHDFNNTLTAIIGFCEIMLPNLPSRSPARPLVEEIIRASDRAASLTRQLLIFSRQQVIQPKVLQLNGVVGELEKFLRRIIGEDVELRTEMEEGLGSVQIDRTQIDQVLMNLAVNARDAMPDGGQLTIRTANVELDGTNVDRQLGATPGSYVLLSVIDTGRGMDRETRSRIFEPFFTTKERGKGTGLGLSTVFGIIQQSSGDISVHSEPGVGTTVSVYLPRVNAQPSNSRLRAVRDIPGGSETILLVEDEAIVRGLAQELLASAGYEVIAACDGDEALSIASSHPGPIDLLLTDMVMPGMSGLQIAERLAAHHPGTKVMFMSGFPGDIAIGAREQLRSAQFLSKPFDKQTLTRQVREALDAPAS